MKINDEIALLLKKFIMLSSMYSSEDVNSLQNNLASTNKPEEALLVPKVDQLKVKPETRFASIRAKLAKNERNPEENLPEQGVNEP